MILRIWKNRKNLSEPEVIALCKKDPDAFGILYDRYFEAIFRFIYQRLGKNEEEAADLTQQTFIKAMHFIDKYEDRGLPFQSWLYRIAQNEVNQFFRKNKQVREVEITDKNVHALFEEIQNGQQGKKDELDLLIQILNAIDQENLDLIELRFFQNLSFKEIAEMYQISEANAKMRIYRILDKINQQWKARYENI